MNARDGSSIMTNPSDVELIERKDAIRALLYHNPRTSDEDVVLAWVEEAAERLRTLAAERDELSEALAGGVVFSEEEADHLKRLERDCQTDSRYLAAVKGRMGFRNAYRRELERSRALQSRLLKAVEGLREAREWLEGWASAENYIAAIDALLQSIEAESGGDEPSELSQLRAQAAWRPDREEVERAMIEAIALLDVAIAGTVFTKPQAGRVVVNVERAQKVLDGLRSALRALPPPPQNPRKVEG